MFSEEEAEVPDCPTPTAHRRLEEIHRLWHEGLEGYQNPEKFRTNLNACIQACRNATFAVQKEKSRIPEFTSWYAEWVTRMKADRIMCWLNEARRTIVHEGDLEMRSIAHVRLIGTYEDAAEDVLGGLANSNRLRSGRASVDNKSQETDTEGATAEFAASPFTSIEAIVDEVMAAGFPSRFVQQATLAIERRWVDSALPDDELLGALAHVYGFLAELVTDAHHRTGLKHCAAMDIHGATVIVGGDEERKGKIPCMITTRADRTLSIGLRDGRPAAGGTSRSIEHNPKLDERALNRYKLKPTRLQNYPMSPHDYVPLYVENAKAILRTGEEHGWFVLLFKGRTMVTTRVLAARNAADKRALAQELAEIVELNRIDGIVDIAEAWYSPLALDGEGYPIPPSENPDRTEAVALHAETADGRVSSVYLPFRRRRFASPVIGAPQMEVESQNNFLAPVRAVWRRWREQGGDG